EVSQAEQERERAEERLRSAREEKERAERLRREAEDRDRSAADALTRAERAAKEAAREAQRLSPRKRGPRSAGSTPLPLRPVDIHPRGTSPAPAPGCGAHADQGPLFLRQWRTPVDPPWPCSAPT